MFFSFRVYSARACAEVFTELFYFIVWRRFIVETTIELNIDKNNHKLNSSCGSFPSQNFESSP